MWTEIFLTIQTDYTVLVIQRIKSETHVDKNSKVFAVTLFAEISFITSHPVSNEHSSETCVFEDVE